MSDSPTPELTVIVPVYNERDTIEEILERVQALAVSKQIVVVDNHSTDGTRELLTSHTPSSNTEIVLQLRNLGKGTSIRTGIERARGEFVVCQDADLEYDPNDLLSLLEVARAGADAVFGSRLSDRQRREGGSRLFSIGRRWVTSWFNLLFGSRLTDVATCYKMVRRSVLQGIPLQGTGFELDFELPAKLRRAGIPIVEVPVSYTPRPFEHGKKINWRDGIKAAWTILRYRLIP